MKYFALIICLLSIWSNAIYAYVSCDNIGVKVESASGPGFHNFSELGVTGSTLFINVTSINCTNSTNEPFTSRVYLVIDDIENSGGLKSLWISMLLSAEARNKTIRFHAYDKGVNSRDFQVLEPYFLTVNP